MKINETLAVLLLLLLCGPLHAKRLLLVGGGGIPEDAARRFVEWAGGGDAKILVVPWATASPSEAFAEIAELFRPFHPACIESSPSKEAMLVEKGKFLAQLARATGVFFTGGDQNRVMEVLADPELYHALRAIHAFGTVFGGTSAGTAIMSSMMITGEGDFTVINGNKVSTSEGLGLLPGAILDQHFIKRARMNRLLGLVLKHPEFVGVGIDERTALAVQDGKAQVLGESQVVLIKKTRTSEVSVQLLPAGTILFSPAFE